MICLRRVAPSRGQAADCAGSSADHRQVERTPGVKVYFRHPYSSKERDSINNLNGLVRYYLPTGPRRLGIRLERIEPGKPQENGRHERMHVTLKREATSPPCQFACGPATALRFERDRSDRLAPRRARPDDATDDERSPSPAPACQTPLICPQSCRARSTVTAFRGTLSARRNSLRWDYPSVAGNGVEQGGNQRARARW